ncbi:DNA topoisomerase I, partial [Thermodesulfobacteriota bacterium]
GMACPLCRTGGIRAKETAKGKLYYYCSNDDCNFISWGKPYYIACPQCKNPFLVEASDSTGKTMLKCPRAICHHWQKFPWEETDELPEKTRESSVSPDINKKPGKKVRRRRRVVVRRKK